MGREYCQCGKVGDHECPYARIAALEAENVRLRERRQILLDEVAQNRDPESVSVGEAIDVLMDANEGKSFGAWNAIVDEVSWSVVVQRMAEDAISPSDQINNLEIALADAQTSDRMAMRLMRERGKERDTLKAEVTRLREIMQYKPGVWSDESRLRSLAENLGVAGPTPPPEPAPDGSETVEEALENAQHLDMETCDERADETHCRHWWDAEGPCCACGSNPHDYAEPAADECRHCCHPASDHRFEEHECDTCSCIRFIGGEPAPDEGGECNTLHCRFGKVHDEHLPGCPHAAPKPAPEEGEGGEYPDECTSCIQSDYMNCDKHPVETESDEDRRRRLWD